MKQQSPEYPILISVVIPVKNGAPWIDECLQGIIAQTLFHQCEIIILDSGSVDETLAIVKKYPARILAVDPKNFNHGETRNFGVKHCRGEYVVMTVQDAKAVDENWLQGLLDGFKTDTQVVGVCGQQVVPHDADKNPADWYRPVSKGKIRKVYFKDSQTFDALSPSEKMNSCGWDDVNAMYKRSILEKIPFKEISYGEDAVWAKDALRAGHKLIYTPFAKLYHYHNENELYSFKRGLTSMYLRYRLFNFKYAEPSFSVIDFCRLFRTIWKSGSPEKIKWLRYNLARFRASKRAYLTFITALAEGEAKLDEVHSYYCDKPPVPLQ